MTTTTVKVAGFVLLNVRVKLLKWLKNGETMTVKKKVAAITANVACAYAMKQINPDVVPAYPITPQTAIMEEFSNYVADGTVDTSLVRVESEHSAMSAAIGASAAGARVMTSTSSQGLALMWEMLYIASALRLPIVMQNVNRALSAPINIHCDHSDSMGARDTGWIQLFSENAQEAYDNTIQAVKIAEDMRVRLPVMILYDGFIVSHAIDRVEFLDDQTVKDFVGEFKPVYPLLDADNPVTVGPFDSLNGYYFEFKRMQEEVMRRAKNVITKVGDDFSKMSGRSYSLFESYQIEDADFVLVILGSAAGTARVAVDTLRQQGIKIGLLKLRVFRPFPVEEIAKTLGLAKAVAVLDRSMSPGAQGGPLFQEIRSALYDHDARPLIVNYIYGLGGRDIELAHFFKVVADLEDLMEQGNKESFIKYLNLRE